MALLLAPCICSSCTHTRIVAQSCCIGSLRLSVLVVMGVAPAHRQHQHHRQHQSRSVTTHRPSRSTSDRVIESSSGRVIESTSDRVIE